MRKSCIVAPYNMHGLRRCMISASFSRAILRCLHRLHYAQGATMLKAKEKSNFMNVLEGDLLEDEVASDRFRSYSLLWFGGINLISSSISLSHYIKRYLSWKMLRLNRLRFVWRVSTSSWELCFSYTSYTVNLLHSKALEKKCVFWSKGP